jgi:hypothetical protein
MNHYEYSTDSDSEEREQLSYIRDEVHRREISDKLHDVDANGLYIRNLLNDMNDKLKQSVVPAVTLGMSALGWMSTMALGAVILVMKLR